MSKRISETEGTPEEPEPSRGAERSFIGFLNTDIKDLEIASSLRRLGNTKVMEWDFETSMPKVHRFAHQEVDVVGWVKRIAHYKVMEWDFRDALPPDEEGMPLPDISGEAFKKTPGPEDVEELIGRLKGFLQYLLVNLADDPARAHIRVQEIAPRVLRLRVVVSPKDQKLLVGQNGATAAAMRNMVKTTAAGEGMQVLLQILSHEEELAESLKESAVR